MTTGSTRYFFRLLIVAVSMPLGAQGHSVLTPEDIASGRVRINNVRQQANAKFDAEQHECQSTFAVTACVHDVGARRIAFMSDLKRQEVVLNDAERLDKSTSKKKSIEERQTQRQASVAENGGTHEATSLQRQQAQQEKQLQHQKKAMTVEANSMVPKSVKLPDAEKLTANRAAHANKLQAAQQRRAERDKRLRDAPTHRRPGLPVPP